MTRLELFAAIRPFAPRHSFTPAMVAAIDALADSFNLPHEGDAALTMALALIKRFEGCKLTAYPDPGSGGDPWTIGWGSTGEGIRKGVTWTQAEADQRLAVDVAKFMGGVSIMAPIANDHQRAALTSFAYNVGQANLKGSTLLKKHNAGDYVGAAAEFAKWNKAAGSVMRGLTTRRAAESQVYQGVNP